MAVHDSNEECASFWKKAMDECGGKKMCLLNNMEVTLSMMLRTVDGSTYQRKLSAIASIREMADLFGDDLDDHLLRKMVIRILESLPGQMWEGKIKVFDALQHITKHCGSSINKDLDLRSTMIKGLLIEIQRK